MKKISCLGKTKQESRTELECIDKSGVEESLAAITGHGCSPRGRTAGIVTAYLLPHYLLLYVILYMNIIEFIHVAIIMLLPTKLTALEL